MTTNQPIEIAAETVDDLTDAELLQLRRFLSPPAAITPDATPDRPALPVRRSPSNITLLSLMLNTGLSRSEALDVWRETAR